MKAVIAYNGDQNKKMRTFIYQGDPDFTLAIAKKEEKVDLEKLPSEDLLVLSEANEEKKK